MHNPDVMKVSLTLMLSVGLATAQEPKTDGINPSVGKSPPGAAPTGKTISLFNGKDLTGWKADVPKKDTEPTAPDSFIVRNGLLVSLGEPRGHLITTSVHQDYRLVTEYRFAGKAGN